MIIAAILYLAGTLRMAVVLSDEERTAWNTFGWPIQGLAVPLVAALAVVATVLHDDPRDDT